MTHADEIWQTLQDLVDCLERGGFPQTEAFSRRLEVDLGGVQAWVITAADLVLHKLVAVRLGRRELLEELIREAGL
jgi:hypothetical protein